MTETTENAGGSVEGDPAQPESPATPAATGTPESGKEPDYKQLYLQAKSKVERANEVERENRDLKSRMQQSPAAAPDHNQSRRARQEQVTRLATVLEDPVAQEIIDMRNELSQTIEGIAQLRELDRIDDPAEREETLKHFEQNSHRLGDIRAAHAEVRRAKLEDERTTLQAEKERLSAELKRLNSKPDPNVARTAVREVPAHEHEVRTMTERDFDAQIDALSRESRHSEKMALQRQLAEGKINLRD